MHHAARDAHAFRTKRGWSFLDFDDVFPLHVVVFILQLTPHKRGSHTPGHEHTEFGDRIRERQLPRQQRNPGVSLQDSAKETDAVDDVDKLGIKLKSVVGLFWCYPNTMQHNAHRPASRAGFCRSVDLPFNRC